MGLRKKQPGPRRKAPQVCGRNPETEVAGAVRVAAKFLRWERIWALRAGESPGLEHSRQVERALRQEIWQGQGRNLGFV